MFQQQQYKELQDKTEKNLPLNWFARSACIKLAVSFFNVFFHNWKNFDGHQNSLHVRTGCVWSVFYGNFLRWRTKPWKWISNLRRKWRYYKNIITSFFSLTYDEPVQLTRFHFLQFNYSWRLNYGAFRFNFDIETLIRVTVTVTITVITAGL